MKKVFLSKVVRSGKLRNHYNYTLFTSFFSSEASKTPSSSSSDNLFNRVQLIRDPKASVLPVLREWVAEGRSVNKSQLGWLVRTLKDFRRYHHALQVSTWMTDSRFMELSPRDIAVRLELIHKLHGIERAEYFFSTLSVKKNSRSLSGALLNCYVHENDVEKAESTMNEMRNGDLADTSFPYNALINLYSKNRKSDKIDKLLEEMERKGIARDKFTLRNLMSHHFGASDASEVERIMKNLIVDWKLYAIAADGFLKLGKKEEALEALRKLGLEAEKMKSRKRKTVLRHLITLYANAGERDEIFRLWEACEVPRQHRDGLHASVISSLAKLGDIEGAEKIFEKWESERMEYDSRVVKCLVCGYCENGLLKKAESLLSRVVEGGESPSASSWNVLANGFAENGELHKAVEMLEKGLSIGRENVSPNHATMGKCLDYLKERGDVSGIVRIIGKLKDSGVLTDDAYLRLTRTCNGTGESFSSILCRMPVDGGKAYKINVDESCSDEVKGSPEIHRG